MSTLPIPIRPPATDTYAPAIAAALRGIASAHTRRAYETGMRQFVAWIGHDEITPDAVREFMDHLTEQEASAATINLRLAAVRRLCSAMEEAGTMDSATAARIVRLKGRKRQGVRTGTWLTTAQVQEIADKLNADPSGKLNAAILALLYGCGLRREEAGALMVEDLMVRDGVQVVCVRHGKGDKERAFGVADWVVGALRAWLDAAGIASGVILRPANGSGEDLNASNVYRRVRRMGALIGVDDLAPHDLRRSCGRHMVDAGADITQVQMVFGHSSREVTMRYLNLQIDLKDPAAKRLVLRIGGKNEA